ncbi:hypothetical protein Sjap_015544 [Stephania japonica]|uniref:Uncharacterized protein n=1 Tax=Stephania japonica TaxID=461633 RepID=A0AAP0IL88_9MAGN
MNKEIYEEGLLKLDTFLVGKVLGNRPMSREAFISTLQKAFHIINGVEIELVGHDNIFAFYFKTKVDCQRVYTGVRGLLTNKSLPCVNLWAHRSQVLGMRGVGRKRFGSKGLIGEVPRVRAARLLMDVIITGAADCGDPFENPILDLGESSECDFRTDSLGSQLGITFYGASDWKWTHLSPYKYYDRDIP